MCRCLVMLANDNGSHYHHSMIPIAFKMPADYPPPERVPPSDADLPDRLLPAQPVRRVSSRVLLADEREVEIDHEGVIYRLRVTSLGKLILTK